MTFSRVLVGLDFHPSSLAALDVGATIASDDGADLQVMHVQEPVMMTPLEAGPGVATSGTMGAVGELMRQARRDLQRILEERGLGDVATPILRVGAPALTLADVALENKCDLLIVGTHWRSGLSRLLQGDVAARLVRRAPCPVLVVPSPTPRLGVVESNRGRQRRPRERMAPERELSGALTSSGTR